MDAGLTGGRFCKARKGTTALVEEHGPLDGLQGHVLTRAPRDAQWTISGLLSETLERGGVAPRPRRRAANA